MRATVRERENKPEVKNTDKLKFARLFRESRGKVYTYKYLQTYLGGVKANYVRALADYCRCNNLPLKTIEKQGYVFPTKSDMRDLLKHNQNQVKHKKKQINIIMKFM